MADVLVLLAHPDLARSRVNRALALAAQALPSTDVEVRDLYALYPDFAIDVGAEQRALTAARTVVWVHPIQWYSMPALMKLWVDDVLAFQWAYGPGGRALAGKCLWLVASTGGSRASYAAPRDREPFEDYLPAYRHTADLVGMHFLPPSFFFDAHRAGEPAVQAHARAFAARLVELAAVARPTAPSPNVAVPAEERRHAD